MKHSTDSVSRCNNAPVSDPPVPHPGCPAYIIGILPEHIIDSSEYQKYENYVVADIHAYLDIGTENQRWLVDPKTCQKALQI